MKRSPRRIIIALLVLLLLAVIALGVSMRVISNQYPTTQTAVVEFELPDNFASVRKILIATGATKQIITMAGDNQFIEEKWSKVGGAFNPFKPMRLELHGTMKVQSNDEYVGKPIVSLTQDTTISNEEVLSRAKMSQPGVRLLDYDLTTQFKRNADTDTDNTVVRLELSQRVLTTAPWFAHRIADNRVLASAESALQNQKRAILKLMDEHR